MRFSQLLPVALLAAAACLAHAGADPAPPRRSLASDPVPTATGARSDWDWCWESLLTLVLCKHDLLASFFEGRPAPRACCIAADEAGHHCGPFTRAFIVGSLLKHGPLAQCALPEATGSPATWPDARVRAPSRPPLKSFRFPPPQPPEVSAAMPAALAKAASGTQAPAALGGAWRDAGARGAPPAPADGNPPKPKVIAGGSAGASRARCLQRRCGCAPGSCGGPTEGSADGETHAG